MSIAGSQADVSASDPAVAARPALDGAAEDAQPLSQDLAILLAMVLAGTAFYLAPWPIVYGAALVMVAGLSWWRLDLAVVLVPLFAPYYMRPKHLGHLMFAPSEIFLVLDAAIGVVYVLLPGASRQPAWERLRRSPFLLPAILFLLAATVSTMLAAERHLALREYREVVAEPLVFFALIMLFAGTLRSSWLLMVGLVVAGVAVGGFALVQYGTHQYHHLTLVPGTSIERVKAFYGSPDNLGLLYDRVVATWFAVAALARLAWWPRLAWSMAGVILLPTLFLTYSRGAWLGVLCGCLLVLALGFPWGRWIVGVAVAIAAAGLLFGGPILVHAFRSGHANTVQRRLDLWQSSLLMLRGHPIFGVGPDNFLHFYAPRRQLYIPCPHGLGYMKPEASAEPCLSHPHDEILDFWLSTGVLGLAAFVWLQVVFWRSAGGAWARLRAGPQRPLLLAAMAAMLAALVHGAVDESYFLIDLAVIFWLLCAVVSFLVTEVRENPMQLEAVP